MFDQILQPMEKTIHHFLYGAQGVSTSINDHIHVKPAFTNEGIDFQVMSPPVLRGVSGLKRLCQAEQVGSWKRPFELAHVIEQHRGCGLGCNRSLNAQVAQEAVA